jgi:enterochelin esterase-like enzyme
MCLTMKRLLLLLPSVIFLTQSFAQTPNVKYGRVERTENFPSAFVTPRHIDVWLPEGYSDKKKYAVLYMHDGQMLFDSTTTWNKQSWRVSETLSKLMTEGKVRDVIVVGIWNGGATRHSDYFPQKPYESLTSIEKDTVIRQLRAAGRTDQTFKPVSDNYLKFVVKELKPLIDKKYATLPNRQNTFIAGSSMGGLISMYAICEYPNVFGGAACLSTHWPGTFKISNNPIPKAFGKYMKTNLPNPKKNKIYFDYGDQTLDALYPPLQHRIDSVMQLRGYDAKNWETKFFAGDDHSEQAWAKRLHIPLLFLLKK